MSMEQLLVFFKNGGWRHTVLWASHFVGLPKATPRKRLFSPTHQLPSPINTAYKSNAEAVFRPDQPKLNKLIGFVRRPPKNFIGVRPQGARAKAQSSPPARFTLPTIT
jgi:hypothetical protein